MTIDPSPTLRSWLRHAGLGDTAVMVFSSAQEAMMPHLREQAAGFRHYSQEEKEAWVLWTAFTHVSHRVDMAKTAAPVIYLPPPDAKPLHWFERPRTLAIALGGQGVLTVLLLLYEVLRSSPHGR